MPIECGGSDFGIAIHLERSTSTWRYVYLCSRPERNPFREVVVAHESLGIGMYPQSHVTGMVTTLTTLNYLHRNLARPEEILICFYIYFLHQIRGAEIPVQRITTSTVLLVGDVMHKLRLQRDGLPFRIKWIVFTRLILSAWTVFPMRQGVLVFKEGVVIRNIKRFHTFQSFWSTT